MFENLKPGFSVSAKIGFNPFHIMVGNPFFFRKKGHEIAIHCGQVPTGLPLSGHDPFKKQLLCPEITICQEDLPGIQGSAIVS